MPAPLPDAVLEPGSAPKAPPPAQAPRSLGQILLDMGAVEPGNLIKAVAMRERQDARLSDLLLAHGWVSEADLIAALSHRWGAQAVDLIAQPPDPRLIDALGVGFCLDHAVLPWRQVGGALVIATARPEEFALLCARLPAETGPVVMALAPQGDIHAALLALRRTALIRGAETRVAAEQSCRSRDARRGNRRLAALFWALAAVTLAAPLVVGQIVFLWAVLTLTLGTGLKLLALGAAARPRKDARLPPPLPAQLPVISVLVPLFRETDIAGRLIARLGRLTYPRALTDILLVVEETDTETQAALAETDLPAWMRVVTVPQGPVQTKPRALNFAQGFARGAIIGVWDAEDAPEPDQLMTVARHFAAAPPEVACLQGVLDYYNPRQNWLARCFTLEYASWFRVVLPGLARLGLVVPLGGTTLFFRRAALDAVGGWDAHNVTEDADLGVRLARHGYRTELIPTVTGEEANCRALPWVRQRSRWLKGYAMTWAVHMRRPGRLWRDLGAWRFCGFQVLFLGALSQYVLAPLMWSFWVASLGLPHPLLATLGAGQATALAALFLGCEAVNLGVTLWAVRGPRHRHLIPWAPTLALYFPLGALAAWKALYEVAANPFYWDKTAHGHSGDVALDPAPEVEEVVWLPLDTRISWPEPDAAARTA